MKELISSGLEALGLTGSVPPDTAEKLAEYGRLLLEKNQVMNLTAIRDEAGVARLHMLDCAALLQSCDFQNKRLLDVGTGAGFPGMVLKILVPSLDVTLLDSLNEKFPAPSKEQDPLAWAAHQNNLTAMAEEIVLKELVYN